MLKIKTFVINVFSLYILVIVRLIFPLLTLPYLTRILSIEAYGLTVYVKSLMVYVQLLIDFGFLLSATKKIVLCRDDKQQIGRVVGDTLVEKIILGAIASAVIFIIMFFIHHFMTTYCFVLYI